MITISIISLTVFLAFTTAYEWFEFITTSSSEQNFIKYLIRKYLNYK